MAEWRPLRPLAFADTPTERRGLAGARVWGVAATVLDEHGVEPPGEVFDSLMHRIEHQTRAEIGYEQAVTAAYRRAGDLLQSAASHTFEYLEVLMDKQGLDVPYEVRMALLEGKTAITLWTEARRHG